MTNSNRKSPSMTPPPAMFASNVSGSTKSVSLRDYEVFTEMYEQAAEKSGKSFSDWARDIMRAQAAKELGVVMPQLPPLERGRYGGLIARAAREAGVPKEVYMRQAAEILAAQHFGFADKPEATTDTRNQIPVLRRAPATPGSSSTRVRAVGAR